LAEALALGAAGIQVGTAFAFCDESGIAPDLKLRIIQASRAGTAHVFTDPAASPTGFPFKVAELSGTLSEAATYAAREKNCDLGYLRQAYRKPDGSVGYRCGGEPLDAYLRKGGNIADTVGRKCLCNGLMATVDLGQMRANGPEPAIVTAGNEVADVARLARDGADQYRAEDVIRYLRGT
jgi:nitronate monooxygenase